MKHKTHPLTSIYLIPYFSIPDVTNARAKMKRWNKIIPSDERLDLIITGNGADSVNAVKVLTSILRSKSKDSQPHMLDFGLDRHDGSRIPVIRNYIKDLKPINLVEFSKNAKKSDRELTLELLEKKVTAAIAISEAYTQGTVRGKKIAFIGDEIFLQSFGHKMIDKNIELKKMAKKIHPEKFFKSIILSEGNFISIKELKRGGLRLKNHQI